jgi:hypothetical protein
MTTIDRSPSLSQSTFLVVFAEGTLVRIRHNTGLYRISSPAAWAEADQSLPTHYNVIGPSGKLHKMVPAESMTFRSNALQETGHTALLDGDIRIDPLTRMLTAPAATMAMARRLLPPAFVETHELRQIAEALLPRYFQTHCHRCGSGLNNLHHPACPDCEGLLCNCGGCRCNWSFPSFGIHGVTGPRIRDFSPRRFSS